MITSCHMLYKWASRKQMSVFPIGLLCLRSSVLLTPHSRVRIAIEWYVLLLYQQYLLRGNLQRLACPVICAIWYCCCCWMCRFCCWQRLLLLYAVSVTSAKLWERIVVISDKFQTFMLQRKTGDWNQVRAILFYCLFWWFFIQRSARNLSIDVTGGRWIEFTKPWKWRTN